MNTLHESISCRVCSLITRDKIFIICLLLEYYETGKYDFIESILVYGIENYCERVNNNCTKLIKSTFKL